MIFRRVPVASRPVKVDALLTGPILDVGTAAAGLEAAGYSGAWSLFAYRNDPDRWQAVMEAIKAI